MSHSSGPFHVETYIPRGSADGTLQVRMGKRIIANVEDLIGDDGYNMAEGNAALLAAAPDMKSALIRALNTLGAKGGPTAAERDGAMASIRIALRKAEPVKTGS